MAKAILAFIATIAVAFFGGSLIEPVMCGPFAVATMGAFILHATEKNHSDRPV